ncbi:MAG TPA: hypothetical protein VGB45_00410 [Abditibacterium sp.]|jgi:hypothetical protein
MILGGALLLILRIIFGPEFGADQATRLFFRFVAALGWGMIGGGLLGWSNDYELINNPIHLREDTLTLQKQSVQLSDIETAIITTGFLQLFWPKKGKQEQMSINLIALENPDGFLLELEKRGVNIQK